MIDINRIKYPLLIDGGISNVLTENGHNLNDKLWTAKLLISDPKALIDVHLAYLSAGAACIATSGYQASIPGFMSLGYSKEEAKDLILKTVTLAEQARETYLSNKPKTTKPLIAASIGPYGAFLANGAEYHGNYGVEDGTIRDFHLERFEILDNSNADLYACETIPSLQETKVLSKLLAERTRPSWISFSCKDGMHLNDGTPLTALAECIQNHPKIFAIGVNCTPPEYISSIINQLRQIAGNKKIIVYPNSGEAYNAVDKTWMGLSDPSAFIKMSHEWLDMGVHIIGGCCRIGPKHIHELSQLLSKRAF